MKPPTTGDTLKRLALIAVGLMGLGWMVLQLVMFAKMVADFIYKPRWVETKALGHKAAVKRANEFIAEQREQFRADVAEGVAAGLKKRGKNG